MADTALLNYVARQTARGLAAGEVYTATKERYTLIGTRDQFQYAVMLLRDGSCMYNETLWYPEEAACKMLQVWNMLRAKLSQGQPKRPYARCTNTHAGSPAPRRR